MSDSLKPGRELDALVAEKVMGWAWVQFAHSEQKGLVPNGVTPPADFLFRVGDDVRKLVPPYSTDIAAAWEVVGKMHDSHPTVRIWPRPFVRPRIWHCEVDGEISDAPTAPHAICLAALKAVS